MAKVVVTIRNGVAEPVEDIRTDVFVEVRNFDVANVTEDLLSKDAEGRPYRSKEWHAAE